MPGWAIQLVLIAALLPFLLAARRSLRALPAAAHPAGARRSAATAAALGFWLWVGRASSARSRCSGSGPTATGGPPCRRTPLRRRTGPCSASSVCSLLGGLGWLARRARAARSRAGAVAPRRSWPGTRPRCSRSASSRCSSSRRTRSRSSSSCPRCTRGSGSRRCGRPAAWPGPRVLAAGFAGPLLLLGSFALRFGLGLDAPWYLAELTAIGYVTLLGVVIAVGWLAAAGQLAALAIGRYAPYPSARERPPRGPLRETSAGRAHSGGVTRRAQPGRAGGIGRRDHAAAVRIARHVMTVAGVGVLVWALVVWHWQDPFTAVYTHLEAAPARVRATSASSPLAVVRAHRRRRAEPSAGRDRRRSPRRQARALPAAARSAARRSGGSASRGSG